MPAPRWFFRFMYDRESAAWERRRDEPKHRELVRCYGRWARLDGRKLKVGRYLFARHGGKLMFFGRFTVLRAYAAIWRGESGRVQSPPADTDRE
jgi:hypothetical protein